MDPVKTAPDSPMEQLYKSIQTFGTLSLNIECRDKLYRYNDALMQSIYSILDDDECSMEEKMAYMNTTLDQYSTATKELLHNLIQLPPEKPRNEAVNPFGKSHPQRFDEIHEITKYNLNHDPATGRFCSGSAVGGISNRTVANGGISVHVKSGREPKDGYMVAVYSDRSEWLKGDEVADPVKRESKIKTYMEKNKDVLADPDNYLGTWYDNETGNISLDISRNFKDRDEAIKFASEHNEKAIWDVANMTEISTGGTGNNI